MVSIEIPDRLNGSTFYGKILPSIYENIIKRDYEIDFDMHRTELVNPEGLVNLLAAAAMITRKNKSKYIPRLYLPESPNLLDFMRRIGFFNSATVPNCQALSFNYSYDDIYNDGYERQSKYLRPQFYGLFTHSETVLNMHYNRLDNFVTKMADSLIDEFDASVLSRYCSMLRQSLQQVVKNSLEHNSGYLGTLAYYMIQKTPYNTIEFAFSDIGQGFLERMKKMLKEKDVDAINKYGHLEQKLNNRELLFKEHEDNPNLLAIIHAIKFREDSEIPGLDKIKRFVLKYNGRLFIHSGNYSVIYEKKKDGIEEKRTQTFHNSSYFSGCHMKIVINLPESKNVKIWR